MASSAEPEPSINNLKRGSSPVPQHEAAASLGGPGTLPQITSGILSEQAADKFDHNALLSEYDNDFNKDAAFEAEFTTRMMDILLETRAWALARPHLETERHGLLLLEEVKSIQAAEAEQDRMRQGLVQFVQNIKSALAALASLV